MKKRILAAVMAVLMALTLGACAGQESGEKTLLSVAALKGPTGMGFARLMELNEKGETAIDYEFTIVSSPDEIVSLITSGSVDVAAAPTNLAAMLYNKTQGGVRLCALNTLGVLYLVENGDTVKSLADLSGKTVYSSGKGATPEYALNYLLAANGVEDCTVEWVAEHSELAALCAQGEVNLALLPEPNVTAVLMKNAEFRIALDLTEQWEQSGADSVLAMGCLIAGESAAAKPEVVDLFLEEYAKSVEYVNENADKAAPLIELYGIMPAAAAQMALPNCNIVCVTGDEMKEGISGFLKVLYDSAPASVGGSLPGDDFYYGAK